MSLRRLDSLGSFSPRAFHHGRNHLSFSADSTRLRSNGIEFRSPIPIAVWLEMAVELDAGESGEPVVCNGIVVSCVGDCLMGYTICIVFLSLNEASQRRLSQIVDSRLA